ncbi:Uncharacterised protein g10761 [Pycnogonum litorale]
MIGIRSQTIWKLKLILLILNFKHSHCAIIRHHIALLLGDTCTFRFDLRHIGPAIDLAIEKSREEYGVDFVLHRGNYSCEKDSFVEALALGTASDLYHFLDSLTAFIGPAVSNEVKVVGAFATYRSIPLITGLGDVINKRARYSTTIRLSHDAKYVANAILAFLKKFSWKKFGVIYRLEDIWFTTVKRDLEHEVKRREIGDWKYEITCTESYLRNKQKRIVNDIRGILKRMKLCSRIIVILGGDRDVRSILLESYDLGIPQSKEFAFLYPELMAHEASGNISWASDNNYSHKEKQKLQEAYRSLLIFSLNQPLSDEYILFSENVKGHALDRYNFVYDEKMVNYYTAAFHDGVVMLAKALRSLETSNPNGRTVVNQLKNTTFQGVSGVITVDENGDRIADYALLDMVDEKNGNFKVALEYISAKDKLHQVREVKWPGGKTPIDRPYCGFDNQDPVCLKDVSNKVPLLEIVITTVVGVAVVCTFLGFAIYRKLKYEAALANMSWRISWDEIKYSCGKDTSNKLTVSRLNIRNVNKHNCITKTEEYDKTGVYKVNVVAIKLIDRQKKVELSRDVLLQLKQMRDIQHENLARFIGVCIDVPHIAIISEYCPKGTLMDVLQNDSLKIDWMFRYSLINDIVKALTYLHSSDVGSHGQLSSRNCIVDSLFVLKVKDFGLPLIRAETSSYSLSAIPSHLLLWYAPELLRLDSCPIQGTKKGDVYSFSIILQEIVLRDDPFCMYNDLHSSSEILFRVKARENPVFRPNLQKFTCIPELYQMMTRCWAEEADQRPDFSQLSDMMKGINRASDGSGNIMDDLLRRMEQYANNLETLVEQRTNAFLEEKRKSEELLYCVLPRSVAEQLKSGMSVVPETFDSVTIFFSDIVGFTAMSSDSSPRQVVDFLNDLYTCFDTIINDFNVYKVETIGDAYMVVSGLPERNGKNHAKEIAKMALSLLKAVENFKIRHQPEEKLKLRIGIHTGSCCAGVVGKTMPRYCLFGDTVNTASRMETTGLPHHIHVSPDTKHVLDVFGTFVLNPRGEIDVKGKGKMFTYWLMDEI